MPFPRFDTDERTSHPFHRGKVTVHGQLNFPMEEGQTGTPIPFKFEIPLDQRIITDITIPGPVVNHEICSDTIINGQLALIQVTESAQDATVTLNNGTPLPLQGRGIPIPTPDTINLPGLAPGFILYCNASGGLTSIKFNSAYCMKVKVFLFGAGTSP
jgi:hypothetical protein